jgi:hypothetical protein
LFVIIKERCPSALPLEEYMVVAQALVQKHGENIEYQGKKKMMLIT